MSQQVTRRRFLQSAAVAAGAAVTAKTFAAPALLSERSPNSKLGTVVIGVANQGIPSVNAACGERLVAMVDVDEKHLAETTKWIEEKHPDVRTASIQRFYDYRQMFDKIHKDIDAVFIAAPDHHHAVASLIAMRLGKHVYCEKPMAHSIAEVHLMMETARKYKVMTQLGNQGHSGESIRLLVRIRLGGRDRRRGRDAQLGSHGPWRRRRPTAQAARSGGAALGRMDRPGRLSRLSREAASQALAELVGVR